MILTTRLLCAAVAMVLIGGGAASAESPKMKMTTPIPESIVTASKSQETVPTFDVKATCEGEAKDKLDIVDPPTVQSCMDEEQSAQQRLEAVWPTFPASLRNDCAQAESVGGYPSYIDLLDCLQEGQTAPKLD